MPKFPGIILGVMLFGLAGGTVALCASIIAGASLIAAAICYSSVGMMSALVFVALTNHNLWGDWEV
jgi:hypothetical protein